MHILDLENCHNYKHLLVFQRLTECQNRTAFNYTRAAVIASSFAWHIHCRFYFQVSRTFSKEEEVLLIIVLPNLSMQSSNLSFPLSKDLKEND